MPVGEREVWKLEKADKRAKMDDEGGSGKPPVVVIRWTDDAEVSKEKTWKERLSELVG